MQALTLPARRGWRWLFEGFMIFRKKPTQMSLFIPGFWILILYINALPLIGPLVVTLLFPAFSVVFMNMCRTVAQGGTPTPQSLFIGLERKNLRAMLTLAGIYVAYSLCVLAIMLWLDDGVLRDMFISGKRPTEQVLEQSNFLTVVGIASGLLVLLTMAYWYAPVLVAWHKLPAGKALFFSFVACIRNWRAFLTYVLTTFAAANLLGVVLGMVSLMLAGAGDKFFAVFSLLLGMVLLPTLYASFYVSYRDVFVVIDEDA